MASRTIAVLSGVYTKLPHIGFSLLIVFRPETGFEGSSDDALDSVVSWISIGAIIRIVSSLSFYGLMPMQVDG